MIPTNPYESFNARNLAPAQIAAGFIPPEQFWRLIANRHSVVIGPRGSGKTTLLKMLQLPALNAWRPEEQPNILKEVSFVGAFIPADIGWSTQVKLLAQGMLSKPVQEKFGTAAFITHTLIGLLDAICESASSQNCSPDLKHLVVQLDKTTEASIVTELARAWQLELDIPSFLSLKLQLRHRLLKVSMLANQISGSSAESINELVYNAVELNLPFIESIVTAVDIVNSYSKSADRKWALLFDELEIAPAYIQNILFQALRSVDHRLIFKLSMSPYLDSLITGHPSSPSPGNDYDAIYLWYMSRDRGAKFSRSLCNAIIKRATGQNIDVLNIFESNGFDETLGSNRSTRSKYSVGGSLQNAFVELRDFDLSFAHYLSKRGIDLASIDKLPEDERAQEIRKVAPIVVARYAYLSLKHPQSASHKLRSRKRKVLIGGAHSMLTVLEGNPRWIIGVMGPLIERYAKKRQPVPIPVQAKAIEGMINTFRSMLVTLPYEPSEGARASRGVLTLLDTAGRYFFERVVRDDFNPEPPLSFIVDSIMDPVVIKALGRALNAGALVICEDTGDRPMTGSLKGKRLRLSYILAAYHKLPIILGRGISLKKIMEQNKANDVDQTDFFVGS